jgi:polynucleotide 5'-kinase involved in rRNA processing
VSAPGPNGFVLPESWWLPLASLGRGTVLVAGGPGTGKTVLAAYLAGQLDRRLARVGLVTIDPRGDRAGLPGCLDLALTGPWEAPAARWLVGGTRLTDRPLRSLEGVERLSRLARSRGAEAVVVDLGAEALEEPGFAARLSRAAATDRVLVLGDGAGAERFVRRLPAGGPEVIRLDPSPLATSAGAPEVAARQRARLRAHLAAASPVSFPRHLLAPAAAAEEGRLVGVLADAGLCLALGLVVAVDSQRAVVVTSVAEPAAVRRLEAATLRFDPAELPGLLPTAG